MVEQRNRRSGGRFYGFRVNCEQVPMLPAWAVRCVWDDPRKIHYLLVWKSRRDDEIKEAVRVTRIVSQTNLPEAESVEVKRTEGSAVWIYLAWRQLPRNGGRNLLLQCRSCGRACRALYGAKVGDDGRFYVVRRADWECRTCAMLRYSSEGGALLIRSRGLISRLFGMGRAARPEPWYPLVFSSLDQAAEAGFI